MGKKIKIGNLFLWLKIIYLHKRPSEKDRKTDMRWKKCRTSEKFIHINYEDRSNEIEIEMFRRGIGCWKDWWQLKTNDNIIRSH